MPVGVRLRLGAKVGVAFWVRVRVRVREKLLDQAYESGSRVTVIIMGKC